MRRLALLLATVAVLVPAAPASAEEFVIGVLGDSYAAGQGSPAVQGVYNDQGEKGLDCIGTCHDETWWTNVSGVTEPQRDDDGWDDETLRCHRSSIATGPEAARRLENAIEAQFPSVEVVLFDLACSGAEIRHLTTTDYAGEDPALKGETPLLPPQIGELQNHLNGRRVDAILMNIGGNDMKFAFWVAACALIPVNCTGNTFVNDEFRKVVPRPALAPPVDRVMPSNSLGSIDERFEHLARRLRSPRTPAEAPRGATSESLADVPGQVYLTGIPQPLQDENGNVCNGTQTADQFYKEIKDGEGEFLRDQVVADMNASLARAAARHGWLLVSEITAAANTHGVCSNASFFRNNLGALHIQGHDLFPGETNFINEILPPGFGLPHLSSGIAHPNNAGYAAYGQIVADKLDDQVEFRFRPPAISLRGATAAPPGFEIQAVDTTRSDTGFWRLEVNGQTFDSDAAGGDFTQIGPIKRWRRSGAGEFVVRIKECFKLRNYCGPYSAAITVANTIPGAPQNVRRVLPNPAELRDRSIRIDWDAGVNTTATTRYEVKYRKSFDAHECNLPTPSGICSPTSQIQLPDPDQTAGTGTTRSFRLGSAGSPLDSDDSWSFRVRACTDAGCGAYSPELNLAVAEPVRKAPIVGVPGLRVPATVRSGKHAMVELTWTTPRRWTDLRDVEIALREPRGRRPARRVATIRFLEGARVLELRGARGRAVSGAPDSDVERVLRRGPIGIDLRRSGLLRYGPEARQVTLRLALVPGKSLRGRLSLAVGARDDRGRRQAPAFAGVLRVR